MTNIRVVASLLALTGAIALAGVAAHAGGWRINHTPSLPMGLWRIGAIQKPIARGDIVAFCPPDREPFREARRRGYLSGGECLGDYEPLLKPVVAIAGDRVEIAPHGIAVNGELLANSHAHSHDRQGRVLSPIATGAQIVAPGEVWVVSNHSPLSFDSRYFGPLSAQQLIGVVPH